MVIERLRDVLQGPADQAWRSDWDISGAALLPEPAELIRAAVLMAVTQEAVPQLLLTKRTAHLRRHAGQIAFPGGRMDPGDVSPVATALREAHEEVALEARHVEVIGQLAPYVTGTGFSVLPVVGLVPSGLTLVPEVSEVEAIFHVPLAHALDPANHELREGNFRGFSSRYFVIRHGNREIWGATAAMIVNLSKLLS